MIRDILKRFFGEKEEPKEQLAFYEVEAWLNDKTKGRQEKLEQDIKLVYFNIKDLRHELKLATDALHHASIKDEDKIEFRVKQVVLGNRISYIRALRILNSALDIPPNSNFVSALKYIETCENEMNEFSKSTQKNYYACQHLFHQEVERIANALRRIDEALKSITNMVQESKVKETIQLKEQIRNLSNKKELRKNLNRQLAEYEEKVVDYNNLKKEKQVEVNSLKQSKECKELIELSNKRKQIKSNITALESEFLTIFSALEHPLRKYSKVSLDFKQLIERYLENPISTLLVDRDKKIITILLSMRKAIESSAIEIKDKKQEKALKVIRDFNHDYIMRFLFRYQGMIDDKNAVEYKMQQYDLLDKIEKQNLEIKELDDRLIRLDEDITATKDKLSKLDIDTEYRGIEEEILNILSVSVEIA